VKLGKNGCVVGQLLKEYSARHSDDFDNHSNSFDTHSDDFARHLDGPIPIQMVLTVI